MSKVYFFARMTACRFICHRVFAKSFCLCGWCKVRLILLLCTTRITRKIKTSIENKRSLRLYKYSFLNKNDSSNLIHFHFPWINYRFGWYIKFKRGGGGKIFQRIHTQDGTPPLFKSQICFVQQINKTFLTVLWI